MTLPEPKTIWRHHNGIHYEVLMIANVASTRDKYPETVVYRNVRNKNVFSRRANDWHRSFTRTDFKVVDLGCTGHNQYTTQLWLDGKLIVTSTTNGSDADTRLASDRAAFVEYGFDMEARIP